MLSSWTFGKKIAAGFGLSFLLLLIIGGVAYRSVKTLSDTSRWVAHTHLALEGIAQVLGLMKDAESGQRGFLLTNDEAFLAPYQAAVPELALKLAALRDLTSDNPNQQRRLGQAEPLVAAKLAELKRTIDGRRKDTNDESVLKGVKAGEGKRVMDDLRKVLAEMDREERDLLVVRAQEVDSAVINANVAIGFGTLLCLLLITGVGFALTRSLTNQIGSAVQHIQSSSSELQTTANQQATGAREQATAMTEITTTINELLATSKQIADSARRVARVADGTAQTARTGEQTAGKTRESMGGIKRQVDLIVTHMLDLGKKSQQIGGILDIINELAEQTNILAINATIEAAGAGEAGSRFAVVANEIRNLADRVAGSAREIRILVDEVRAAVNTTVMTTESGTKAVEAGVVQFSEVALVLKDIVGSVGTTTEAAREIELSTKQQTTAVEQVNLAATDVATAARETEAGLRQTLETATLLNNLSLNLVRLIRPTPGV